MEKLLKPWAQLESEGRRRLHRNGATHDEAEDLIAKWHKKLIALTAEHLDKPNAYAFKVLKNLWRDALKKKTRHPEVSLDSLAEAGQEISTPEEPLSCLMAGAEEASTHMVWKRLVGYIGYAFKADEALLRGCLEEGRALRTTAEELGITASEARTRVREIRDQLRTELLKAAQYDRALRGNMELIGLLGETDESTAPVLS